MVDSHGDTISVVYTKNWLQAWHLVESTFYSYGHMASITPYYTFRDMTLSFEKHFLRKKMRKRFDRKVDQCWRLIFIECSLHVKLKAKSKKNQTRVSRNVYFRCYLGCSRSQIHSIMNVYCASIKSQQSLICLLLTLVWDNKEKYEISICETLLTLLVRWRTWKTFVIS